MGMTAVTCVKCKSVRRAFSLIAEQGNENVMLSQWERDDTNRVTKLVISITVADYWVVWRKSGQILYPIAISMTSKVNILAKQG